MTSRTAGSVALWLRSWTTCGFGQVLFLMILGTACVVTGPSGESGPWKGPASGSSDEQPLLQHSFSTVSPVPLQIQYGANLTEHNVRKRRSSSPADAGDSAVPPNILTASHLSSLRDLVSDKKITVRLGLRVSLRGPSELLGPQLLLFLNKELGIYNTGGMSGLFSMRVVRIQKLTSTP